MYNHMMKKNEDKGCDSYFNMKTHLIVLLAEVLSRVIILKKREN